MSVLVVGSVAFDTLETPFASATKCVGGSATYISLAANFFAQPVRLVGVVGGDFPRATVDDLARRGIDMTGLQVVEEGKTFHWHGRYHYDMNTRDTISTELNVFAAFDPRIPDAHRASDFVVLGNIDPVLQRRVLDQVARPKLIVCDTMNFWIERQYDDVLAILKLVDVIIINDGEARELTRQPSLIKAGRMIRDMGPSIVIIKKGEHGALLFANGNVFSAPAYPLESVFDPTGAGDTFAGGFTGWLAKTGDLSHDNLRRAVVYGSVLASFCVEKFGAERLLSLNDDEVFDRFLQFKELARFEEVV